MDYLCFMGATLRIAIIRLISNHTARNMLINGGSYTELDTRKRLIKRGVGAGISQTFYGSSSSISIPFAFNQPNLHALASSSVLKYPIIS